MYPGMEVMQKVYDRFIILYLTQKPKPNRRERMKQKHSMMDWAQLIESKYLRISNFFKKNEMVNLLILHMHFFKLQL